MNLWSNYEVAELKFENGQLSMHGLGGRVPPDPAKPLWARASGTLESIVHQATRHHNPNPNLVTSDRNPTNHIDSIFASNGGRLIKNTCELHMGLESMKKRSRSESTPNRRHCSTNDDLRANRSTCASASATFCRDTDATMVTWTSSAAPSSSKKTKSTEEDSACHGVSVNPEVDQEQEIIKTEDLRSHSTRRSRVAIVHNQSERRRRDRINQKINALQKLVPNSSKTDKASMLEEVIEYLKRLQAQVHEMMSFRTTMPMQPQMMMPAMAIQQQLHQMSLLASMGMGMGLGMLEMNPCATAPTIPPPLHPNSTATPAFVQSPFLMPPMMPTHSTAPASCSDPIPNPPISVPSEPYYALLAQSMNMEMYNKMGALYRQQLFQIAQSNSTTTSNTTSLRSKIEKNNH